MQPAATADHGRPESSLAQAGAADRPESPFRWKRYTFLASVVPAIILVIRVNGYVTGRMLEVTGALSPVVLLALSLLVLIPLLFVRTFSGFYHIGRYPGSSKMAPVLVAPFAAIALLLILPIPSFEEGVARTIREKASGADLSAMARSFIAAPPSWLKEEWSPELLPEKLQWLNSTYPLDRIGLSKYTTVRVEGDTLQFHWGSPIAQRWGLAISAIPEGAPTLPTRAATSLAIYPEVSVFTLFD